MGRAKSIVSGTYWTTLSTIIIAVVQILRLAILTRFLEKSEFGIVAIVTLILGLTHTFCDMGFSSAIMHKQKLSRQEFSSLYWIQFSVFILIYIAVFIIAFPISSFYGEEVLSILIPIALLDLFFKGFGQLYETLLVKAFRFRLIAIRNIISALISLIIAVILAMRGAGVYSLVISTLFNTIFLNIWNLISGYKEMPLLAFCNISLVKPLIKIGLFQTGTQILDYISSKIDIIILGKLLGTYNLGIYNLAKELVLKFVQVINSIANRVALPFFSKIQEDKLSMRTNYCRLLSLLSVINIPLCTTFGILSVPIVTLLYGNSYSEMPPILTVLSVWAIMVCIGNPVGNIVIATGQTKKSFHYTILRIAVFIPITYISASISFQTLVWAQIFLAVISLIATWYLLLYKIINLKLTEFLQSFVKCLLFSTLILYPMYCFVKNNIFSLQNLYMQIIIYGFISLVAFVIYGLLFGRKEIIEMTALAKSLRKRNNE